MDDTRISAILERIHDVTVAVYGDFCLDAYWLLDPGGSEISVETGLRGQAIRRQRYSLGGASNIVANLAALRPASIRVIGVIGDDLFGRELTRQLTDLGADTGHLVIQCEDFDTVTFGKPCLEGKELPRMDFGFFNRRTAVTDAALLAGIERALEEADVLILNQQVPGSICNPAFIDDVNRLTAAFAERLVLLDSRHYGERFRGVCRKTNEEECAGLNGVAIALGETVRTELLQAWARALYERSGRPVFVTRGERGLLVVDAGGAHEVAGIELAGDLDPVGAGDTTISVLGLCLAAGCASAEAAEVANIAAAVTVQKLLVTGTASGEEILALGRCAHYVYRPELAADPTRAQFLGMTNIEVCGDTGSAPGSAGA